MNDEIKNICPFDFFTDFDYWFRWHELIYFLKLNPEKATRNCLLEKCKFPPNSLVLFTTESYQKMITNEDYKKTKFYFTS